jgi:hypothetical protein
MTESNTMESVKQEKSFDDEGIFSTQSPKKVIEEPILESP